MPVPQDFSLQMTNSMNAALSTKFDDALRAARQSARIWNLTGRPITSLSGLNKWVVPMMDDFYTNNGMSTMQFGTQMNGLEQGAKGTASGARVLSRTSSTACLQTLTYNSATDATTSDSATYPDECYFDPRYTTLLKTIQASRTSQCVSPAVSVTLCPLHCYSHFVSRRVFQFASRRATLCCLHPLRL